MLQDLSGPKIRTGPLRRRHFRSGTATAASSRKATPPAARAHLHAVRRALHVRRSPASGCCSTTGGSSWRSRPSRRAIDDAGGARRPARRAQGHQRARRGAAGRRRSRRRTSTIFAFGIALGVDMVALSFVQTADDVRAARATPCGRGRARSADHRQDRAARGRRAPRRDPRGGRRRDGRARRSRRSRCRSRQVPRVQKRDRAGRARAWRARDRRDAGARVDARRAAADARGGQRRRERGRRRRRRDHAGGRDGRRARIPCGPSQTLDAIIRDAEAVLDPSVRVRRRSPRSAPSTAGRCAKRR